MTEVIKLQELLDREPPGNRTVALEELLRNAGAEDGSLIEISPMHIWKWQLPFPTFANYNVLATQGEE